jgi:hypothetical protein
MQRIFPTFCHISDYGDQGYGTLHRMMATSLPLILWAPSSLEIDRSFANSKSRLDSRALLRYIETGLVQVMGREEWILSKGFRDKRPWPGAKWNPAFDRALQSICRSDESLPEESRRVRVVEEEDGKEWAAQYIDEHPQEIQKIWTLIQTGQVPQGSLEKAKLFGPERRHEAAQIVLRDARNHSRAIELSGAKRPFLDIHDGHFFGLLESPLERASDHSAQPSASEEHLQIWPILESLLVRLEWRPRERTLTKYLGSEAHIELVKYYSKISERAQNSMPEYLDMFLLEDILDKVTSGTKRDWKTALGIPFGSVEKSAFAGSLVLELAGLAVDPTQVSQIASVGLMVVAIGTGVSRKLGLLRPNYEGPHWPFLYAFGHQPSRREIDSVVGLLDQLLNHARRRIRPTGQMNL